MAGYSKIYCVGGEGGFLGADGINPIDFQILVGDADRQWLEVHYFNRDIKPIGRARVIIPAGPDHPDSLIDACLVFFPEYFESCPSLAKVVKTLGNVSRIDFHLGGEPSGWAQLREEARPLFKYLVIYKADLQKVNGLQHTMSGSYFFGEDENAVDNYEERKNPYDQWQEKQAQRRRTRRTNHQRTAKKV